MTAWFAALPGVYGADARLLAQQQRRMEELLAAFRAHWGPGEVWLVRAPGRVNLVGEHTDYNHGFVLPMALDKDVVIALRPRQDSLVRLRNVEEQFATRSFEISPEIPRLAMGDWANYAQGPAQLLAQRFGSLTGFDALVDGSPGLGVPRGAGLSSSSALTVAAAVALVSTNQLPLAGPALADACGQAEWYVGTRGGVMDQFASLLSRQGHALFLDCRPDAVDHSFNYAHVPLPSGYQVVVLDSQVHHANTGPHFNRRVAEGRVGVALLKKQYPTITHLRDVQVKAWAEVEPYLPEEITSQELRALGIDPDHILDAGRSADTNVYSVRARCRHVYTENVRVLATISALEQGDVAKVGEIMLAAHRSAALDYEISTPELDLLVAETVRCGAVGARLTGAGWGGCIVALVPDDRVSDLVAQVKTTYAAQTGLQAESFVCRSAQGAGLMFKTKV